jgi:hypothetical protein
MPDKPADSSVPSEVPPVKKPKHGDIREDGKVFYNHTKHCKNGEQWVTPEQFARYRKNKQERRKKNLAENQKYQRDWRAKNQERSKEHTRRWRDKNPGYWAQNARKRRKADPLFDLRGRVRNRIYLALRGSKKTKRTNQILGITIPELARHLESLFMPGMTWGNRSEWHLDHIVPSSCACNANEVYTLNHYTNLRPLWGKENLSKGKKLPEALPEYIHADVKEIWLREQKQYDQRTN